MFITELFLFILIAIVSVMFIRFHNMFVDIYNVEINIYYKLEQIVNAMKEKK